MDRLNFPIFRFQFKSNENRTYILDPLRKKYVVMTAEEWVRQHVIQFLIQTHKLQKTLMNSEKKVVVNGISKRFDVVVYEPKGTIALLVECKAPSIKISQKTFDQIALYQRTLKAKYLMVTNGMSHYYCKSNDSHYEFLKDFPNLFTTL